VQLGQDQQFFSFRPLPISGYWCDRLLFIFSFGFCISFLNLHCGVGGHSNKYPSCTKPRPLAAIMKTLLAILIIIILQVNVFGQNKSVSYKNFLDSINSEFLFTSDLTLNSNNSFLLNYRETGNCHTCYFYSIRGTWISKMDSILLYDTYEESEAKVFSDAVFDSAQKDYLFTIVDQNGRKLSNIKIGYDPLNLDTSNIYYTDKNGQVIIKRDSLEAWKKKHNSHENIIHQAITYSLPDGTIVTNRGYFSLPANVITFKINYVPPVKYYQRITYYLKVANGLTFIKQNINKPNDNTIEYWGNFVLVE